MATPRRPAKRKRTAKTSESESREGLILDREAIRHWRVQRGFTQQALADQRAQIDGETVQVSYAQIRRIEKEGRAGPATARILAVLLGVDLAQLRPRDARQLACGLPREVSVDFVGRRAEVDAVLAALSREESVRIAASVEGLPGVGKTELALQVCGICERTGSYRIFWFDAETPDLAPQWAGTVAQHLGIEHREERERARLALRAVEALGEPTLIVLDNLERWSASEPWPRPQGRHIRWLVTTRVSRLGERAFEHIEVPVLDEGSATELMIRIAGPQLAERPGFRDLVRQLDGYTIAIELAAAFLGRFPEIEPAEYLKTLAEGKSGLLEAEVASLSPYQQTVESSLELLWRRLPASTRSAWELAACFAQDTASHALSDACGLDRKRRALLRDFHLIQSDSRGWSMHRLVRDFARHRTGAGALALAHASLVRGAAAHLTGAGFARSVSRYHADRAHLDIALDLAAAHGTDDPETLPDLQRCIGEARFESGQNPAARPLLESAARFYRTRAAELDGPANRPKLGRTLYKLAWTYDAMYGRDFDYESTRGTVTAAREAVAAFDRAEFPHEWADAQRMLGSALENLAIALPAEARFQEATDAHRAALEVYTREANPLEWASTQQRLGAALCTQGTITGDPEPLEEAVQAYRAALEIQSKEANPRAWASTHRELGFLVGLRFEQTGRMELSDEAIAACHEGLSSCARDKDPDHWGNLQHTLAVQLVDRGETTRQREPFQAAARACRSALEVYERERTPLAWANSITLLGQTLAAEGRYFRCAESLSAAIESLRASLEEFTADRNRGRRARNEGLLGAALAGLAELRSDRAGAASGVDLCREAVAAVEVGPSMLWADCCQSLAKALGSLSRCSGERELLREAVLCCKRAQSVFDPTRFPHVWQQIDRACEEFEAEFAAR